MNEKTNGSGSRRRRRKNQRPNLETHIPIEFHINLKDLIFETSGNKSS